MTASERRILAFLIRQNRAVFRMCARIAFTLAAGRVTSENAQRMDELMEAFEKESEEMVKRLEMEGL